MEQRANPTQRVFFRNMTPTVSKDGTLKHDGRNSRHQEQGETSKWS